MSNPFRIGENEEVGRFLISTERFQKGDQVWEEIPIVGAPRSLLERFTCVSCCKVLENQDLVCSVCSWPCCSISCSKNVHHRDLECKLLSKLDHRKDFGYLIILRILLTKLKDPSRYEEFCSLCNTFSDDEAPWKINFDVRAMDLYNFLVSECQISVSISEVTRILTAYQINNFKFVLNVEGTYAGSMLYHYSSFVSNNCSPNLEFCFVKRESPDGDTIFVIRFYARKDIEPGDTLSMAYCPPDMDLGTVPRQRRILMTCGFICKCDRCKDKTEGGSYFQALVCPECGRDKGYLLPLDPIETMISPWKCDSCDLLVDAFNITTIISTLVETPDFLRDTLEATAGSLDVAQQFIELHSGYLIHQNHYLLFTCRMHWLLGCSVVNEGLVSPDDSSALTLFLQIKSTFEICLPRCLEFMPSAIIAMVYFIMAHSYAALIFKSHNLRSYEPGIHQFHKQWRVCKIIAGYLENCLLWKRMKPHDPTNQYYSRVFLRWSGKEKAFESEINMGEDMALECIRYLFVEF